MAIRHLAYLTSEAIQARPKIFCCLSIEAPDARGVCMSVYIFAQLFMNVYGRDKKFCIQQAMETVLVVKRKTVDKIWLQDAHGIIGESQLWLAAFVETVKI
jgi:hypothetical protein